jgi:hypothetical protein
MMVPDTLLTNLSPVGLIRSWNMLTILLNIILSSPDSRVGYCLHPGFQ